MGHNAGYEHGSNDETFFSKTQEQLLLIELPTPLPEECDFVSKIAKYRPGCLRRSLSYDNVARCCHIIIRYIS